MTHYAANYDDTQKKPGVTAPLRRLSLIGISMLAVVVGLVGGFGAVVFRDLIGLFHNILFLGRLSVFYDANVHTPASAWGALVILAPVVGAFGVAFLVQTFAPEAEGHGVPEVMDAIYYNKGVIRPIVALVKSLASALSIGSGGSVGREGPIVQIGSTFGSAIGSWLGLSVSQRVTLIAAGAGAGIAATFNTPVGGVLFAVEIMLHEVSVNTLVPVTIATATASYVGQLFFGTHPSFVIPILETPYFHITNPLVLIFYVGLGIILGAVAALFIKSIYYFEDLFHSCIKSSYYVRHVPGMLLVGMTFYLLKIATGHYYVEGVGYSTIQDILTGALVAPLLMMVLFALKLLVTGLTLGSGASGGVFSPALYLGATVGGAFGFAVSRLFPGLGISPAAFAVAGMAGVVGGATGAALAAIVMIFEMTLDYSVIIPMTITVAVSYGVRRMLCKESIYTLKLIRRGHAMPDALQTNFRPVQRAQDMMSTQFAVVLQSSTLKELCRAESNAPLHYLVKAAAGISRVVSRSEITRFADHCDQAVTISDIAKTNCVKVPNDATAREVIAKMRAEGATTAVVVRSGPTSGPDEIVGIITDDLLADALAETMELYSG